MIGPEAVLGKRDIPGGHAEVLTRPLAAEDDIAEELARKKPSDLGRSQIECPIKLEDGAVHGFENQWVRDLIDTWCLLRLRLPQDHEARADEDSPIAQIEIILKNEGRTINLKDLASLKRLSATGKKVGEFIQSLLEDLFRRSRQLVAHSGGVRFRLDHWDSQPCVHLVRQSDDQEAYGYLCPTPIHTFKSFIGTVIGLSC